MKENAQRILSWLYAANTSTRWVPVIELSLISPGLSEGGLRSVVQYLSERKRVVTEQVGNDLSVSLTGHGMKALTDQIPVFSSSRQQWQGTWQGVFFLQAPKGDKHFRYLRRLLLAEHALPVTRGIFLYPGELPERVVFELGNSYEGAVLTAEIKEWTFGDEREVISQNAQLGDLASSYSSISKEIDSLLALEIPLKSFNDQAKLRFSSVFDRLFWALKNDYGIFHYYFPQVEGGLELLARLQSLTSLKEQ